MEPRVGGGRREMKEMVVEMESLSGSGWEGMVVVVGW